MVDISLHAVLSPDDRLKVWRVTASVSPWARKDGSVIWGASEHLAPSSHHQAPHPLTYLQVLACKVEDDRQWWGVLKRTSKTQDGVVASLSAMQDILSVLPDSLTDTRQVEPVTV